MTGPSEAQIKIDERPFAEPFVETGKNERLHVGELLEPGVVIDTDAHDTVRDPVGLGVARHLLADGIVPDFKSAVGVDALGESQPF